MTDWLGIEIFSVMALTCIAGIVVCIIAERRTRDPITKSQGSQEHD